MEKKTIGSLIAALRKAKGMTQRDLAERLNVSDKSVSRWERDEGAPDLSLIPVIAEIFGITCDELLRGECRSEAEREAAKALENSNETFNENTGQNFGGTFSAAVKLSAKGEKECKRILQSRLNIYKILSFVGCGMALLGLIVTMLVNFIAFRTYIGFLAGCIFYLTSAVFQVVLIFIAFMTVSDKSLNTEDVNRFKHSVIRQAEWNFGLIGGLLGFSLPLALHYTQYIFSWFTMGSWLTYGLIFAAIAIIIYSIICYFLNAYLLKKGVYSLPAKEAGIYWHNHKLKRKFAFILIATITITVILQNVLTCGGSAFILAKGTEFHDYESFITYMEQDISGPYTYPGEESISTDEIVYVENYTENVSNRKEIFLTKLTDREGNVLCEYMDLNRSVCSIRYKEKDGSILPITVVTYDEMNYARAQISVIRTVFAVLYVIEVLATFLIYPRKRAR